MNRLIIAALVMALTLGTTEALAHHKDWHQIPPGHLKKRLGTDVVPLRMVPQGKEWVCVIETTDPDDPFAAVVFSEWLARDEAEVVVEEEGGFIIIHPDFATREGCETFAFFEQ